MSMKRVALAAFGALVVMSLSSCGTGSNGAQQAGYILRESVEATATIANVNYRLVVLTDRPGLALISATASNPTSAQVRSKAVDRFTVSDSSGVIVFDTHPPGLPGFLVGVPLEPGASHEVTHTFDLTSIGTWTAALPDVAATQGATPLSVQFESVNR